MMEHLDGVDGVGLSAEAFEGLFTQCNQRLGFVAKRVVTSHQCQL